MKDTIRVEGFELRRSKVNSQQYVLVILTSDGDFVVTGDHWNPSYPVPTDIAWDLKEKN